MKITYLDFETREIIDVIDDPSLDIYKVHAEHYAASLDATVIRIFPGQDDNEWTIELKIPIEVRKAHTPCLGERVYFSVKLYSCDFEVSGVYSHKKNQFHVVLDDYGGEWKIRSLWQLRKLTCLKQS